MKIAELLNGERRPFIGDGMQVLSQTEAARFDADLERVSNAFERLVANRPEHQADFMARRDLTFSLPIAVGEYALKGSEELEDVLVMPSRTSGNRVRTELILSAYTMTDSYPRRLQCLGGLAVFTDLRFLKANQHQVGEFAELLDEVMCIVQPQTVSV